MPSLILSCGRWGERRTLSFVLGVYEAIYVGMAELAQEERWP